MTKPMNHFLSSCVTELCQKIESGKRFLLGITGSPGAGKSTLAEALTASINDSFRRNIAIVVPMDGYHLSNAELISRELLPLKGTPDTFDADSFVHMLERLQGSTSETIRLPRFDRSIEASIPDAIAIHPSHLLCIIEGNYLLLDQEPWLKCKNILDECWYLDVSIATIEPRLIERHVQGGKTPEEARAKMLSTDLPNAELIATTRIYADKIIKVEEF